MSENMFSCILTDRGNFAISTSSTSGMDKGMHMVPGIEYVTTITPIGALVLTSLSDWVELLLSGLIPEGACVYAVAANDRLAAESEHDKACMLASTLDFKWMDTEEIRTILYGFTAEEADWIDSIT